MRRRKPLAERVVFKVKRNKGELPRNGNRCLFKQCALPLLRCGEIHLENAQPIQWVAIGKCIQPGAKYDILPHAGAHCLTQSIFRVAASRGHKRTKRPRNRSTLALLIDHKTRSKKRHGNRIDENAGLIEQLMRSTPCRNAISCAACLACLHAFESNRKLARTMVHMTWIGWALLSAAFAAVTALLAKVGVAHVDPNLATAIRTTVVVVFAWAIALALGTHNEIRTLDRRALLFLTLSGLATGLSWLCYFRALQLGPASRVAPLDKLSVPLVMLFAWLLLGEKLTAGSVIGGALITAGAMVMVLA